MNPADRSAAASVPTDLPHRPSARHAPWMLAADALLIVLFAALGNRTHLSGLGVLDILTTAFPFLLAWSLGSALMRTWRRPSRTWPDGAVVLAVTVVLGLALRVFTGLGGAPMSFVLVTTGSLAVLLLGRRALTGLLLPHTRC